MLDNFSLPRILAKTDPNPIH